MLKLLTITLTRSSSLLVDGDGGASLLPEVLERLLPLLTRPKLADLHGEVADIACRILSLLARTAPGLAAALARGTLTLFEGACLQHVGVEGRSPSALLLPLGRRPSPLFLLSRHPLSRAPA